MAIADIGIGVRTVNHWIGGRPVASTSGRSGVVWNPATGEAQAMVDFASAEEVDRAVAAAKSAFAEWRATPLSRRSEVMFKLRELVDANRRQHRRNVARSNMARRCRTPWAKWRAAWRTSSSPAAFPTC